MRGRVMRQSSRAHVHLCAQLPVVALGALVVRARPATAHGSAATSASGTRRKHHARPHSDGPHIRSVGNSGEGRGKPGSRHRSHLNLDPYAEIKRQRYRTTPTRHGRTKNEFKAHASSVLVDHRLQFLGVAAGARLSQISHVQRVHRPPYVLACPSGHALCNDISKSFLSLIMCYDYA
ncbi:hypothetical protein EVAR_36937_1 [Eumeta japonica]|uniref:Secreted protein n=1 Tax=Eumeta variegata TaxID=151549 RepID=A0A4C1X889_EUMVA|nr:hypothetical protein EVAR_36937_1 [Eumeta japonica]